MLLLYTRLIDGTPKQSAARKNPHLQSFFGKQPKDLVDLHSEKLRATNFRCQLRSTYYLERRTFL